MKLITFVLSTALFLTTPSLANEEAPSTPEPTRECAVKHLERVDVAYSKMVRDIEYEQKFYLFNAAKARLGQHELEALHAPNPDEYVDANGAEIEGLQQSMSVLQKKMLGLESVIAVLTEEYRRLDAAFTSSCGPVEEVFQFIPEICEETNNFYATCRYANNTIPKVSSF